MPPRPIHVSDLPAMAGKDLGVSEWHPVTQEDIHAFANVTHDHQWIHTDVERARRESPFGGPIAHGFYTLSMAPFLLGQIWEVSGVQGGVNYGLNRLRFPAPVPAGSRIRAHGRLETVEEAPGGVQCVLTLTIEVEGVEKPACVAQLVFRYFV
jgi:acyl dehydratase